MLRSNGLQTSNSNTIHHKALDVNIAMDLATSVLTMVYLANLAGRGVMRQYIFPTQVKIMNAEEAFTSLTSRLTTVFPTIRPIVVGGVSVIEITRVAVL